HYSHILGNTPYGLITLIDYKDISFHFGEVQCDYIYMFVGNVMPNKEDQLFDKARVFLNTLNEWINVSGFSIDKSGLITNQYTFSYKKPSSLGVHASEQYQSALHFSFQHNYPSVSIDKRDYEEVNTELLLKQD